MPSLHRQVDCAPSLHPVPSGQCRCFPSRTAKSASGPPPPWSQAKPSRSASFSPPPPWPAPSALRRCSPPSGAAWRSSPSPARSASTELAVRNPVRWRRIRLSPPRLRPPASPSSTAGWPPSSCIPASPRRSASASCPTSRRSSPFPPASLGHSRAHCCWPPALVNYIGADSRARVMTALNWLKVPVLVALVGWAFVSAATPVGQPVAARRPPLPVPIPSSQPSPEPPSPHSSASAAGGRQAKSPARSAIPRARCPSPSPAACSWSTALYFLVSLAFLAVVPLEQIQSNTAFVAQFGQALFGASGRPRPLRLRHSLRPRRAHGPHHGRAPRDLCAGARRNRRIPLRPPRAPSPASIPAIGTPRTPSCCRPPWPSQSSLSAHSTASSPSSSFPRSSFSPSPRPPFSVPSPRPPLVVSCRAHRLHRRLRAFWPLMLLLHNLRSRLLGAAIVLAGLPVRLLVLRASANNVAVALIPATAATDN